MALALKEREPDHEYLFAITVTGREIAAVMEPHWAKLESLLGQPLIRVPAPTLVQMIVKFKALPNWRMRWCTRVIKIEPFMEWAIQNAPCQCCIGIRADEVEGSDAREGTDWSGIENITQDLPLVRWGWGLEQVQCYLKQKEVVIPKRTDCDCCFFQRLIEWWELWKFYPELWRECEALEAFTGHTFRSDQRDTWPASLMGLRLEFEKGRVPIDTRNREPKRKTMCSWCAR